MNRSIVAAMAVLGRALAVLPEFVVGREDVTFMEAVIVITRQRRQLSLALGGIGIARGVSLAEQILAAAEGKR